jgi:signal transduction histidine kinase
VKPGTILVGVVAGAVALSGALSNLLDNAVKWTPAGGTVELSLHHGVLTVRDHGPSFATADLPHVFERFYRADDSRGRPGARPLQPLTAGDGAPAVGTPGHECRAKLSQTGIAAQSWG